MMQQLHSWVYVTENFMLTLLKHKFLFPNNDFRAMPTVHLWNYTHTRGFPGDSDSKESVCNAGDSGSIPGSGRSPEEGIGYPDLYSCLEISMDKWAWKTAIHGIAKSGTQLSDYPFHFHYCLFLKLYTKNLWILVNSYTKYQSSWWATLPYKELDYFKQ